MAEMGQLLGWVLDGWDRNNRILVNLLGAVPKDGFDARALPDSPTVRELFLHIHGTRCFFVGEASPAFALALPEHWREERDPLRIAAMLDESGAAVHKAVMQAIETGQGLRVRHRDPVQFVDHIIWHEGYHHGQIKLALKAAGLRLSDEFIGPGTWGVWMER